MDFGWAAREFDRRASTYDQSPFHVALAEAAVRFSAPTVTENVLDIATGTGLVLRGMSELPVDRLTGVDVSSAMLAVAQEALPGARFLQTDATHLPFESGEFDVITCVSAMPYLGDPVEAVCAWRRVLADDGRIIVSVFASEGLTGPTLLRRAAAQHGVIVADPNEASSTVEAWRNIAARSQLTVVRTERWETQTSPVTAASLLAHHYPFDTRNDLVTATSERQALVEATLESMVAATNDWVARVLLVELRA